MFIINIKHVHFTQISNFFVHVSTFITLIRFHSVYQMCLRVISAPDGADPDVVPSVFVYTNQSRENTCSAQHQYITTSPA